MAKKQPKAYKAAKAIVGKEANTTAAPPFYRQLRWQCLLLLLFAVALYANTLGHDFSLDDAIVITDNSIVQRGVSGFAELFSHDSFYGFFNDDSKASLVAGGRYRPLTLAMFAVEQTLSDGPFLHHFFNLLWYGGLVVIIFLFVRDLAKTDKRLPWWFAFAVAALFAAHPLHTEVVANIKGRDEIVALLGAVGGTWWIWQSAQRNNFMGAAAGAIMVFLACLAKENALTFLAVIPAVLLLFGKKQGGGGLAYALPAVGAVGLFLVVRTAVIGFGLGEPVMEVMNNPFLEIRGNQWVEMSAGTRLATVMHTLWEYLRLLFVPTGLVHDYYPMAIPAKSWGQLTPWLGLLLHTGIGVIALMKWRSWPFLALGILIYLASLSIVSNVFFSVGTNMSERFLFMPSLGWALAVTVLVVVGTRKFGAALAWVIPATVLLFAGLTIARNPVWADNFTLFTTDVLRQPNSAKLRNAAGGVRIDRYQSLIFDAQQTTRSQQLLTDARADLDQAIALHPTYKNAYLLRGNANLLLKDYAAAVADYDRALELDGGYQAARDNLVIALTAAGKDAGEVQGNIRKAFEYLRRAEQLSPNDYETLRLLGVASGVSGQTAQALSYFQRASQARPDDAEARWNYAIALYNAGQTDAAETEFQAAERLKPGIRRERAGN
jgi:cytochrome c-type biogenesis protein CcmH/NrfG